MATCGTQVCFHGAYHDKAQARAKESQVEGSFIRGTLFGHGDYRYMVLTPIERNPAIATQEIIGVLRRLGLRANGRFNTGAGYSVRKLRGAVGIVFDYDGGDRDSRIVRQVLKAAGYAVEVKEDGQTLVISKGEKNPVSRRRKKRNPRLVDAIRPGDRVTILTSHGQERTGRAVMRSSTGGWVLNMGGPHGTPGLADEDNIIRVKQAKRNPSTILEIVERRGKSTKRKKKRTGRRRRAGQRKRKLYAIVKGSKKNPAAIMAGLTAGAAAEAVRALSSHFGKNHRIRKVAMR